MSAKGGSNRRKDRMISNDNVLQHSTRSSIHDLLVERPGLTFSEIMKDLRIKESTLRYHLRYLERNEIIRKKFEDGHGSYFSILEGTISKRGSMDLPPLLLKILDTIDDDPGLDQKHLSYKIKRNRFITSYHLRRLMDMGLVRKERDGKHTRYYRISREDLKRRILLEIVDDLLEGEIDEKRYFELKKELKKME